ncbi:RIIa domain-containing protein 1 isoform X2 [Talpa occidentalis]|uniref:RIIa domain-containing protein 1 isoform X2 n=1 Tax=Talpa occidentalis TaxID=50954 RepID=UPI00188F9998|nr:RIIa domain-containing protein 1 isoform X2 [Talpa occidentalis]
MKLQSPISLQASTSSGEVRSANTTSNSEYETLIQTRIANEKYLRTHKEVELLISGFFREMFLKRPDNIPEFAADYFTDPRLPNKIRMQLIKEKKAA